MVIYGVGVKRRVYEGILALAKCFTHHGTIKTSRFNSDVYNCGISNMTSALTLRSLSSLSLLQQSVRISRQQFYRVCSEWVCSGESVLVSLFWVSLFWVSLFWVSFFWVSFFWVSLFWVSLFLVARVSRCVFVMCWVWMLSPRERSRWVGRVHRWSDIYFNPPSLVLKATMPRPF